ncbi:MAG: Alanine--anticapsin ligase [Deltaproteobacteria bacterium]|nr:Alanine--anticapsin ligase [Deltaproteobacteria bacterium]
MDKTSIAVILIIPSASYRSNAFMNAADKLDLKILVVTDNSQVFSDQFPDNIITMNFDHWTEKLDEISEWSDRFNLMAVIGVDEESILLAAIFSQYLGIEHNSIESVMRTKNKLLMRFELKKARMNCPWFRSFSIEKLPDDIIEEINFPCVIKPTFLSASQGVLRVNNEQEFKEGFQILTDLLSQKKIKKRGGEEANYIMVEEYIPGNEVSIEGIVSQGKLKILAIFDKPEPLEGPTFEETIFVTPTTLSGSMQSSLYETAQQAMETLGIVKGPVHIEVRINSNGNYILECASRSIGGMCSKILEFQGGMSLEELILRSSLGRNIEKSNLSDTAKGVMMMPIKNSGKLKEMRGVEEAISVDGITDLQITIKPGEMLDPLPKGDRYLGFLFAEGKNQEMVIKDLKNAWSKIEVVTEDT